jgi:2'-5' RNA ligase
MRLFFAGDLPEKQKLAIAKLLENLKASRADVKWVSPANFHITFRFLGEVKPDQLEGLKKIGEEVGKLYGSFQISFKEIGSFPSKEDPRVVWIGVDEGKSELCMLAQALESRLIRLGFKEADHPFKPHLTLGRVKSHKGRKELQQKLELPIPSFESWLLNAFSLKESQLAKSGPIYKDLFVFPLGHR